MRSTALLAAALSLSATVASAAASSAFVVVSAPLSQSSPPSVGRIVLPSGKSSTRRGEGDVPPLTLPWSTTTPTTTHRCCHGRRRNFLRPPLTTLQSRRDDDEILPSPSSPSLLIRSFRVVADSISSSASSEATERKRRSGGGDDDDRVRPLYVDASSSITESPVANGASTEKNGESEKEEESTANADALAINREIVRRGLAFVERTKGERDNNPFEGGGGVVVDGDGVLTTDGPPERVPGCVANVRVRVSLVPIDDGDAGNRDVGDCDDDDEALLLARAAKYSVVLDGDADALLSRGLLSLLAEALGGEGVTAADVLVSLKSDGRDTAELLGLRSVLSEGRNDGLAGMTRVVRRQIRGLLLGNGGEEKVEGGENGFEVEKIEEEQISNNGKRRPTVAVLLSGGVDSSVALHLLLNRGYDVTAFYLRIWLEDELSHLGQCPWEDDYAVCKSVCEHAGGVPLETISLQEQYRDRVIQYTIDEARRGRTPNPDVMCNSRIKFGCFYDEIKGRGFDYVASGHYARLEKEAKVDESTNGEGDGEGQGKGNGEGVVRLHRAPDPVKDQSYFLSALTQSQLQRVLFPLGNMQKSEVRSLADEFGLPNRNRPDSQGLCFLGKVKFDHFLSAYLGDDPGDIVDAADGRIIGQHRGLWYHTVGQRKGIGPVLDPLETSRGPWYVVAKDPDRNAVIVSNRYNEEEAFDKSRLDFYVEDIRWIKGTAPAQLLRTSDDDNDGDDAAADGEDGRQRRRRQWKEGRFDVKIRHGPTIVGATLTPDESSSTTMPGETTTTMTVPTAGNVRLDERDKGLAPGQFCVFYDPVGDECLGSGVISERHWATFLADEDDDDDESGDAAPELRPRSTREELTTVKEV